MARRADAASAYSTIPHPLDRPSAPARPTRQQSWRCTRAPNTQRRERAATNRPRIAPSWLTEGEGDLTRQSSFRFVREEVASLVYGVQLRGGRGLALEHVCVQHLPHGAHVVLELLRTTGRRPCRAQPRQFTAVSIHADPSLSSFYAQYAADTCVFHHKKQNSSNNEQSSSTAGWFDSGPLDATTRSTRKRIRIRKGESEEKGSRRKQIEVYL